MGKNEKGISESCAGTKEKKNKAPVRLRGEERKFFVPGNPFL